MTVPTGSDSTGSRLIKPKAESLYRSTLKFSSSAVISRIGLMGSPLLLFQELPGAELTPVQGQEPCDLVTVFPLAPVTVPFMRPAVGRGPARPAVIVRLSDARYFLAHASI